MIISAGYSERSKILNVIIDDEMHDIPGTHSDAVNTAAMAAINDVEYAYPVFEYQNLTIKFDGVFLYGVVHIDDSVLSITRAPYDGLCSLYEVCFPSYEEALYIRERIEKIISG